MIKNTGTTITLDEDYKNLVERAILVMVRPYGSFAAFGKAIGISRQAVRQWFTKREVSDRHLSEVCELTGISPILLNPRRILLSTLKNIKDSDWLQAIDSSCDTEEENEYLLGVEQYPVLADYKKKK